MSAGAGHLKWSIPRRSGQKDVAAHEGPLSHIAVSPDGEKIGTCSRLLDQAWPAP